MTLQLELSDLAHLDKIRSALSSNDPRKQFATLGMQQILIAEDAVDQLIPTIEQQLKRVGRNGIKQRQVHLIADAVVIERDGKNLKDMLYQRLTNRFSVRRITLRDEHPALHADEHAIDQAAAASKGADCIVSIGGGTITDIAKIAAMRNDVPVHIVVQTAASVDGFTDNFSVVLQNGVKRTLLTRWPDVVLTDCRTLAHAPHGLNAAGFGELFSMFVAPGDWLFASKFGLDDSYSPTLIDLLAVCGEGVEEWASGIGERSIEGIRRLAAGLAMRGIVTGVGGTSASLSGMEHLISHMLDIHCAETGDPTGLHGAQVGVASVIAAAAWEIFCERMVETPLDPIRLTPDLSIAESRCKAAFERLDPTGRLGAECWSHYRKKLVKWQENADAVTATFADWQGVRNERDKIVLGSHAIASCLHQAKAPKRYSDLEPAISEDLLRWAVTHCQFMRERFTIADLLTFAGWWDEEGVDRVLARAEKACKAAEARGA
jgi:glycerol-1-phosphate dehydrogenase [NAD(P)+]